MHSKIKLTKMVGKTQTKLRKETNKSTVFKVNKITILKEKTEY